MSDKPQQPKRPAMKLDDYSRGLILARVENLTAEYHQAVKQMTKEFEIERKRLETMLRLNFVPQRMDT